MGPGGPPPGRAGCGCGCLSSFFITIALIVIIGMSSVAFMDSDIPKSTVVREKLPASAVQETAYYTDEDGDWIHNPSKLERGLKSFYKETGVQPYVYILKNGSVDSVDVLASNAEGLYKQLFNDNAHFLLIFCDDGNGSYNCGYHIGSQAKAIMDDEAIGILSDYLDQYYNDYSISEEEIFSNTFEDTGKRIMTVTKSPAVPISICVAVVAVALILAWVFKKRTEAKEKERQQMEDILNTPLEKYGDGDDAENLAKKYENNDE